MRIKKLLFYLGYCIAILDADRDVMGFDLQRPVPWSTGDNSPAAWPVVLNRRMDAQNTNMALKFEYQFFIVITALAL